jgi:hypothetical protein
MDKDHEASLLGIAQALRAVMPIELADEPDESLKEIRPAKSLSERLENWGSD